MIPGSNAVDEAKHTDDSLSDSDRRQDVVSWLLHFDDEVSSRQWDREKRWNWLADVNM